MGHHKVKGGRGSLVWDPVGWGGGDCSPGFAAQVAEYDRDATFSVLRNPLSDVSDTLRR